jgi:predicted DsbA family dithiol-disulfide isomerase
MRKYGRTAQDVANGKAMQIERGNAIGFKFDLEKRTHFYNTFDAHRLLLWALEQGRQVALKKILLRAYFSEGQNPSDQQTLARLAAGRVGPGTGERGVGVWRVRRRGA